MTGSGWANDVVAVDGEPGMVTTEKFVLPLQFKPSSASLPLISCVVLILK